MTVLCLFCKEKGQPGKSRVIESRKMDFRGVLANERIRTETIRRRRECLDCGYRWTTVETMQFRSTGFGYTRERVQCV